MLHVQLGLSTELGSAAQSGNDKNLHELIDGLIESGWSVEDFDTLKAGFARALASLAVDAEDIADLMTFLRPSTAAAVSVYSPEVVRAAAHVEAADETPMVPTSSAAKAQPQKANSEATTSAASNQTQTLRVNISVLEDLMTMVSELVLTRNQLMQILRAYGDSPFAAPLQRLNQVTGDLQESVMMTRMQPIGNAWGKLPRLVRDLSHDLHKKIDLVMIGADTELDRQILESIRDPLTHMVRNSADHGIEAVAERVAAGKPETGKIELSARHEGGHIVVQISDDGRGLPTARIREKALASGVATEAQLDAMNEQQIQQFIFHAGLSTASAVTNVSGRGVGMDVVRSNIEKIGGIIEFHSEAGVGSRFLIKIPLTLAIVSALIVECAGERFAMPQSSVVELVRISRTSSQRVEEIDGQPVYRLRDKLLPLVSLREILDLPEPEGDEGKTDDGTYFVVSQVGNFVFGIIVDRIFDTEEIVVKPVSRTMRHIPCFSGNTILGDGQVIMILDPNGLAGSIVGARLAEAAAPTTSREQMHKSRDVVSMLLFEVGGEGPKAVPLSLVARLEEADLSKAEAAGDRTALQYRGGLMPLIDFEGRPAPREGKKQILVFVDGKRMLGLVVDRVLDIVEATLNLQLSGGNRPGLLGSAVIAGHSTDVIDTVHYLRQCDAEWFEIETETPYGEESDCNILLVEDSVFFRNLLEPMLKLAGYHVTVAAHGEAALEICRDNQPFDIVVSDIEMPGLNGFDFAHQLRKTDTYKQVPLIALSSHASPKDIERAHKHGFDEYVTKLDPKALLGMLTKVLSSKDVRTEEAA
ncbi:MAG: hybrid sensor histidine kinase/response regulator [Alphaproteobacteria bacterium HGW-Alphaproteobacteria-5]|nr:MAG: hybrid sensor histidine kinase/response regulator [Alphaproteobacteria bacterium HGW-Alphaproteobacteria-5]